MAFPLLGNPKEGFSDSSGSPLASGTLAVLDPADDTNKASYPTADDADAATNANINPVVLNARGEAPTGLFAVDGEDYKLVLKDVLGATIWTVDDIRMPIALPFLQTAAETAASVTPTNLEFPEGNVLRYKTNTTPGTTNMTTAFTDAVKVMNDGFSAQGYVYAPGGYYLIDDIDFGSVGLIGDGQITTGRQAQNDAAYATLGNFGGTVLVHNTTSGTALHFGISGNFDYGRTVRDFILIGKTTSTAIGIEFEDVVSAYIQHVRVANFSIGVQLDFAEECLFDSLLIQGCATGLKVTTTVGTNQNTFVQFEAQQCATGINALSGANNGFYGGLIQGGTNLVDGVILSGCIGYVFHNFWWEATWSGNAISTTGISCARHRFIDCNLGQTAVNTIALGTTSGTAGKHQFINFRQGNNSTITVDASVNGCLFENCDSFTITDNASQTTIIEDGAYRPQELRIDYDRGQTRNTTALAPIQLNGMAASGTEYVLVGADTVPADVFSISMVGGARLDLRDSAAALAHQWQFDGDALVGKDLEIDGALNHDGSTAAFYGTVPIVQQTGVAVSAAGVHAALVNLGLITA